MTWHLARAIAEDTLALLAVLGGAAALLALLLTALAPRRRP